MNKLQFILFLALLTGMPLLAQQKTETKNVILITLDGFRWQELYRGVESGIVDNPKFVTNRSSLADFEGVSNEEKRASLLPFFWNTIATQGQLYGNRALKSYANCSNPYWFSYPGYSEMLVGSVDRKIRSNGKTLNPNATVFDFLNQSNKFKNQVGAFSTWDVFPYILRESVSGILVNSGLECVNGDSISSNEALLNQIQTKNGKRYDSITFHLAFEYLKRTHPRLLYIALDETDSHAHGGRYDQYLLAAHQADEWISKLWSWIQSQPAYKDQTTLLITSDHGRGRNARRNWRNHGRHIFGSSEVWMAALGPDTPPEGEMTSNQIYQKQIAKTLATFLGEDYQNEFVVGETIHSMFLPQPLMADLSKQAVVEIGQKK